MGKNFAGFNPILASAGLEEGARGFLRRHGGVFVVVRQFLEFSWYQFTSAGSASWTGQGQRPGCSQFD